MTLIDYLNRVHFADDILEEALWAELEGDRSNPALVISDKAHMSGEMEQRFRAGLPVRQPYEEFIEAPERPSEGIALSLAATYREKGCGTLIAFGSGHAIDLTKLVRLLVSHDLPLSAFSVSEGGGHRITKVMPKMIAVPTLRGLSSGLNGLATVTLKSGGTLDIASKKLMPTVTICDPTPTVGASPASHASAGVTAIARCVEALLSPNFNPPADGIALDGLRRAVKSIHRATRADEPEARREMMAAGLNAALVQQNGLGPAYAICKSLETVSKGAVDCGAVTRLILPEVLRFYALGARPGPTPLSDALGVRDAGAVADRISTLLAKLPLPDSLTEIGIHPDEVSQAAPLVARHRAVGNGPHIPQVRDILSIMNSVQ
ncbi:MAG: 4-hydroxybutyrate dehydrogenase [Paracoccaceae bacterium]|jgi:4-hydroxybutyrate dehydrogenase